MYEAATLSQRDCGGNGFEGVKRNLQGESEMAET